MKLGVVILNYNTSNSVVNLINKIQNYSDIDYIVIVDNNSAKEDSQLLRKVISNKVEVIYSKENSGYASGNNIGIRRLIDDKKVDVVVICNPDIFFENEVIKKIKETFKNNLDYAILGSHRVDGKNKHTQRQYWKLPTFKSELKELSIIFDNSKTENCYKFSDTIEEVVEVEVVPGCFWAARADILKRVDYLDEHTFLWYEENILAKKIQRIGYKKGVLTKTTIVHDHDLATTNNFNYQSAKIGATSRWYYISKYSDFAIWKKLVLKIMICLNLLCFRIYCYLRRNKNGKSRSKN